MEINTNNPVGNPTQGQIQGLETPSRVSETQQDKEDAPERQTVRADENPDYRISLSKASKQAIADLSGSETSAPSTEQPDPTEEQAAQVARQASAQLAQTNAAISNQAISKAVDLFT